jgi:thiamine biosynthesis protein ThiS
VELNLEIVPRERHDHTIVSEGDIIEAVTLVGGG